MKQRISPQEVSAGLMEGLMKTEDYIKRAGIDHRLLELMKYRVSQINGCVYCLDMHHKEAIRLGETEQRLHSLVAWEESPYYTDKERAVLAYAEALTRISKKTVDDELSAELARFFTKAEIADLTLAVTQINTWNRINKAFRILPAEDRKAERTAPVANN